MTKPSGKLDRALCYLSGAMEFAADCGVGWRKQFINMAWNRGLNIDFIDPTNKPGINRGINEEKQHQIHLQKIGDFKKLQEYVHRYRRFDLRSVDFCDFVVVVIDPKIHLCGTYNEVFFAEMQHKPIFFICDGGLSNLPRWLFGVIKLDEPDKNIRCNVFETLEDLINELIALNVGDLPMSDEWVLIRKDIEESRIYNFSNP